MTIVFLGPPGSGKGTQSSLLSQHNFVHISTGDLIREEIREKTQTAKVLEEILSRGELVPDNLVIELLTAKISSLQPQANILLDGFPRTVTQALELESICEIDKVISFYAPEELLIQRLQNRGLTSGRVDDKEISTIKNRLSIYEKESQEIIKFYGDKVFHVNADGTIKEIFDDIKIICL